MLSMQNTISCKMLNRHGVYYDDFRKSVVDFYEAELEGTDFYRNVLMKIDYTNGSVRTIENSQRYADDTSSFCCYKWALVIITTRRRNRNSSPSIN